MRNNGRMPGPVLLYGAGHSFLQLFWLLTPGPPLSARKRPPCTAQGRSAPASRPQQHGRCERSRLRRIQKSSHILNARKMRMITQLKIQRRRTGGKADAYQRQRRMQRARPGRRADHRRHGQHPGQKAQSQAGKVHPARADPCKKIPLVCSFPAPQERLPPSPLLKGHCFFQKLEALSNIS